MFVRGAIGRCHRRRFLDPARFAHHERDSAAVGREGDRLGLFLVGNEVKPRNSLRRWTLPLRPLPLRDLLPSVFLVFRSHLIHLIIFQHLVSFETPG